MGVISNLGYIAKASHFQCALPDPLLVIEAAVTAVGPVLLNAASFGCNDIIKLRAGIAPWHSRGIRALIEGAIPPNEKSMAGKLLKFTIPLEKALFFFFVVDLTVDFFARWQSQIFKLGACHGILDERTASGPYRVWVEPHDGNWARIAYTVTNHGPIFCSETDFAVPSGWYFNAYFSLTVAPMFPFIPIHSMQMRLRDAGSPSLTFNQPPNTPGWFGNPINGGIHIPAHHNQGPNKVYVFEASADGPAFGTGGSMAVSISREPILNESILPVNCLGDTPIGTNVL